MIKKTEPSLSEKKLSKIVYILLVFIFLILAKGMFNQYNNINQDKVLAPVFLILCIIFCVIYSANAFTTGNLVRNWSSPLIFMKIFNRIKKRNIISDEKAIKKTTFCFGYFTMNLALICIIVLIYYLYNGTW
jgi:hypothetical protein